MATDSADGRPHYREEIVMRKRWSAALGLGFVLVASTPAHAQASRTWVSGVGDDANPCSRTAPCKTFAGAISKTAARGEISVLDPGGFGAVTITKSISIISEGVVAGVLAAGTNGIVINAAPTDVVTIRGLDINGFGSGIRGVRVLGASAVHIENTQIYGFTQDAIDASVGSTRLFIRDTIVRNNTRGIFIGDSVDASLDNVRSEQNGFGVRAIGSSQVVVRNSVTTGNTGHGLAAVSTGVPIVALTVENTVTANNGAAGVHSQGAGATVNLTNTTIVGNLNGITVASLAAVVSFGNNRITGNTTNGAPTATIAPQ